MVCACIPPLWFSSLPINSSQDCILVVVADRTPESTIEMLSNASQRHALKVADHDSDLRPLGCLSDKCKVLEQGVG